MGVIGGRVVRTPREDTPYKVVLQHDQGAESEHPVSSVKEGEALIREKSPPPQPLIHELREWHPVI